MRLRLTDSAMVAFEEAGKEPLSTINQANGISVETYLSLLKEIERFIPEFESAVGMKGARVWIGERLHEAVLNGRTTIDRHLTSQYFSSFELSTDTAYILIENYELAKARMGLMRRSHQAYDLTVLRFMLTRSVHEDTHSHLHKTEYSALFSELVDKTKRRIEEKRPSPRIKIKRLPLELTAPIYLKEKEEITARRMQRFALNAFLKVYYERNPDWYGLLGVPLFLPPHPNVVEEIKRITRSEVDFKTGFMSRYRPILSEYVGAIAATEERIYEDAELYYRSRTDYLINLVKNCLNGDYSDLRTKEREVVWQPGRELKI